MQLSLAEIQSPQYSIQSPVKYGNNVSVRGLTRDVFEKSRDPVSPSFASRSRGSANTSAGAVLRALDGLTCPYSGVRMISPASMQNIESRLRKCKTIKDQIKILEHYTPCMQKLEKKMFGIFKEYANKNPNGSMASCLGELKQPCLAKLKVEQLGVLNEIDNISNNLDSKTALSVRALTTDARYRVIHDDHGQIFRRKDILNNLRNTTKYCPNKETIEQIWETAGKLPKSATNMNAFVVKYSSRGSNEIASRLLSPSMSSIEHITPASKSGRNSLENFMPVSKDWNSDRGDTPMPEYIRQHPEIPRNTQKYADDIIKFIQNGRLTGCDWYPYVLKETLYSESKGLIDLDLSKYNISEETALVGIPSKIKTRYLELKQRHSV